jgi:hypothetical protein
LLACVTRVSRVAGTRTSSCSYVCDGMRVCARDHASSQVRSSTMCWRVLLVAGWASRSEATGSSCGEAKGSGSALETGSHGEWMARNVEMARLPTSA